MESGKVRICPRMMRACQLRGDREIAVSANVRISTLRQGFASAKVRETGNKAAAMKRSAGIPIAACLGAILGSVPLISAAAADNAVAVHELQEVTGSGEVLTARWMRQPDSYTLQVQLDPIRHAAKVEAARAASMERMAAGREPVPARVEQEASNREPVAPTTRGDLFIGRTIANLRGMDPALCDRILTVIDGRELARNGRNPPQSRGHRVGVSILKADGSEIQPSGYSCVADSAAIDVQYRYSIEDSAHAVTAAVRIDDVYYSEKLQPLAQQPVPADIQ
jgi:hypothetical protein